MAIMSTITMTALAQICLMQIQQSLGGKLPSSEGDQCVRAKEPSSLSYSYGTKIWKKNCCQERKTYTSLVIFFSSEGNGGSSWQRINEGNMTDYEIMYDFDKLYAAHKKCRLGKAGKKEVVEFELNLSEELVRLQKELKEKTYQVGDYYKFTIFDPKRREIQALSYRDRIVQHNLCDNILAPLLERYLIYDNSACRKNKGAHFAMERLNKFFREFYKKHGTNGYILKCDIKKYFDSIDHKVLKTKLSRVIRDPDVLLLLFTIIDSYEKTPGKGLPMGNQTSQWFALYYLDGLDRLIKEKYRIKYYTRYMDDCIMIHDDKTYLRECLDALTRYIENELLLEFNQKTQLTTIKNGVDYLGFRFYLTDTGKVIRRLRTSSKKRLKRRLKKFQREYRQDKIKLGDITHSIASYKGHLKHGHTDRLQQKIFHDFVLTKDTDTEKYCEEQGGEQK